jgi:hypothetical protein
MSTSASPMTYPAFSSRLKGRNAPLGQIPSRVYRGFIALDDAEFQPVQARQRPRTHGVKHTPENVRLLLPPRQSRGISQRIRIPSRWPRTR